MLKDEERGGGGTENEMERFDLRRKCKEWEQKKKMQWTGTTGEDLYMAPTPDPIGKRRKEKKKETKERHKRKSSHGKN